MAACFPRGKLLLFSVYFNSAHLMTRVEYFGIIGARLIAKCFAFIFHYNLTAAMKKFRVSAYRQITRVRRRPLAKSIVSCPCKLHEPTL